MLSNRLDDESQMALHMEIPQYYSKTLLPTGESPSMSKNPSMVNIIQEEKLAQT